MSESAHIYLDYIKHWNRIGMFCLLELRRLMIGVSFDWIQNIL